MKHEPENIVSKLRKELPKIKSQYNVTTLEVFGSIVRREQKANSYLDILVTFSQSPSLFKFIESEDYLSEIIGVKVDLVMKSSLKPTIGKRIISEAQTII